MFVELLAMNRQITISRFVLSALVALTLLALPACSRGKPPQDDAGVAPFPEPHLSVVADGLFGPVGLEALPNGTLPIAEEGTGGCDDSAGATMLLPDGSIGRLLSGLPSTRDSGDLAGVPLTKLSPDGATPLQPRVRYPRIYCTITPFQCEIPFQ